jgi:hypothetical protein
MFALLYISTLVLVKYFKKEGNNGNATNTTNKHNDSRELHGVLSCDSEHGDE